MRAKPFSRGAGVLLSITSLPSPYGIGTLGEAAYQFVKLLVDLRQRYWQVLPLGPTGFGDSPYQSSSAFAGNPYLIDLELLIQEGLLTVQEVESYNWGGDWNQVDYGRLYENRYQVLRQAYARFDGSAKAYRDFCRRQSCWLEDYSFFMALKTFSENRPWHQWEPEIRDMGEADKNRYRERLKAEIDFWKFCQYEFYSQWMRLKQYANGRGIQIIGDVPFYMAADSADVWIHRDLFELGPDGRPEFVAGCPPDIFSEEDQVWGSPLYAWEEMEKDGFGWWRERIRFQTEIYDAIRVDSSLGMIRSYGVPAGTRRGGRWRRGPGRKLMEVIGEAAGECRIIAEDLGPEVPSGRKLVTRAGWPGMKVLLFAFDGDTANEFLPHNYASANAVVYTGTHDNDTIVGYFRDKTEYELAFLYEYLGIKAKEDIPNALIRLAYSSIADVVILPMQDILGIGAEGRMNRPSTLGGNWRWRVGGEVLDDEKRSFVRTLSAIYRR